MAAESKPLAPTLAEERFGNLDVKAPEETGDVPWGGRQPVEAAESRDGTVVGESGNEDSHSRPRNDAGESTERDSVEPALTEVEEEYTATATLVARDPPQQEQDRNIEPENDDLYHPAKVSTSEGETPQHKSLFGSWGKTMRSLVRSQSDLRNSMPNGGVHPADIFDVDNDRRESTPGSYPVEEAFASVPESPPRPDAPEGEVLEEDSIEQEHEPLPVVKIGAGTTTIANDIDLHVRELAPGERGVEEEPEHEIAEGSILSGDEDYQASPDSEEDEGEAITRSANHMIPGEPIATEEIHHHDTQFDMSGNEAIPGTMTHGAATLENEAVEAIPGTMTHGTDSPAFEAGIEHTVPGHLPHQDYGELAEAGKAPGSLPPVDFPEVAEPSLIAHSGDPLPANSLMGSLQGETLDSIAEAAPRSPRILGYQITESSNSSIPPEDAEDEVLPDGIEIEAPQTEETMFALELPREKAIGVAENIPSVEDGPPLNHSPMQEGAPGLEPSPLSHDVTQELSEPATHMVYEGDDDASLSDSEEDTALVSKSNAGDERELSVGLDEDAASTAEDLQNKTAGPTHQDDSEPNYDTLSTSDSLESAETQPDQDTTAESVPLPAIDSTSAEQDEPNKALPEAGPEPDLEQDISPLETSDCEDDIEPTHPVSGHFRSDDQSSDSNARFPRAEDKDDPDPRTPQTLGQDIDHALEGPESSVTDYGQEEVPRQGVEHVRVDQDSGPVSPDDFDQGIAPTARPESYSAHNEHDYCGDENAEQDDNQPLGRNDHHRGNVWWDRVNLPEHPSEKDERDEVGLVEEVEVVRQIERHQKQSDDDLDTKAPAVTALEEPTHASETSLPNNAIHDSYEHIVDPNQLHIGGHGQSEEFYQSLLESYTDHETPGLSGSNADSGSQPFVTPLASAGFRSPLNFEDAHSSLEDDISVVDEVNHQYDQDDDHNSNIDDRLSQADEANSQYELEDEYSTTVHGQDDLFEDNSDGSVEDVEDDDHDALGSNDQESGDPWVKEQIITCDVLPLGDDDEPKTAVPMAAEQLANGPQYSPGEQEHPSVPEMHYLDEPAHSTSDLPTVESQPIPESYAHDSEHDSSDNDTPVIRQHSTPPLQPTLVPVTPDTSSMTLLQSTPSTADRGLADSRHNPDRPRTPEQRSTHRSAVDEEPEPFAPRDVTNIPWHSRTDSFPQSLHSQSTISSSPISTRDSPLRNDGHEPEIHDGSPAYSHSHLLSGITGRPRGDSQASSSYDNFSYDTKAAAAQWLRRESESGSRPLSLHSGDDDGNQQHHRNSVGPGSLFQKMRSIFEQTGAAGDAPVAPHFTGGATWSGRGRSPVSSRPASWAASHPPTRRVGVVAGPARDFGGGSAAEMVSGDDEDDGYNPRRGRFLAQVEGQNDERSSLLGGGY